LIASTGNRFVNRLQEITKTQEYYATNVFATYTDTFNEKHNVKLMGGFNWETKHIKDLAAIGYNLLSDTLSDLNLIGSGADGIVQQEVGGGQNEYALAGFFARANYDYMGRYLFEVSGRYDGTSRFAAHSRWGFFPSASVGWRISEEPFFAPAKDIFENLKVRYSYGTLGNQQVGYYDYIRKISIDTQSYRFGNDSDPTMATISAPVSGDLTWETSEQHNIGIDAGIFDNKLTLTAEAYIRDTKNMLTTGKDLPATYGATLPKMNAADLRTKGYEISLSYRDMFQLAGKPFTYSITGTFSDYVTDITKFENDTKSLGSHYVGKRWGEIWGYRTDGLFASDEEAKNYPIDQSYVNPSINSSIGDPGLKAGDMKFKDLDGDGKIGLGDNTVDKSGDRTIIGNSEPRYNYGLNLSFQWAGFDFSIFFQGIGKMDWYPAANTIMFWGPYARPYATLMPYDFHKMIWSEDNPDAYFPRPRGVIAQSGNQCLAVINDRYLQDISYCRLKNLTIGYSLPKRWTDKADIDGVRFYFSGENLHYWAPGMHTDYIDPEMAKTNSNTMRIYPWQKTFVFGVDLTF
jgi:TonB-linked SusC/RagA family outer membrane protein